MMHYITVSIISLGFLFALYMAILKREKTFKFNRFFLLFAVILCLITPILEFSTPKAIAAIPTIDTQLFENSQIEDEVINFQNVEVIHKQTPRSVQLFIFLYAIVTLLLIFRFGKHLFQMIKLLKTVEFKINGMNVIYTDQKNNSYSFFNYLFIHPNDFFQYQNFNVVLEHELVHSRQLHSLDVIVMELISCFFWFNPFIWLFKKELFLNHEFLADQGVIEAGISLDDYSKTIIH